MVMEQEKEKMDGSMVGDALKSVKERRGEWREWLVEL